MQVRSLTFRCHRQPWTPARVLAASALVAFPSTRSLPRAVWRALLETPPRSRPGYVHVANISEAHKDVHWPKHMRRSCVLDSQNQKHPRTRVAHSSGSTLGPGGTAPKSCPAPAPQIFGHSSSATGWIKRFYSKFRLAVVASQMMRRQAPKYFFLTATGGSIKMSQYRKRNFSTAERDFFIKISEFTEERFVNCTISGTHRNLNIIGK